MRQARFALTLALAAVLAACAGPGPAATPTAAPSSPAQSGAAASADTPSGAGERRAPASESPTEAPSDAPTKEPPATESPTDATETPSASGGSDAAAACTGTDENRAFFANAAAAVDWTVVCAVLPNRWFVVRRHVPAGAGGGRLMIVYKGPHNATLSAVARARGAPTRRAARPAGTEVGPATLGPMEGTLFRLADGGFAIAVDQGEADLLAVRDPWHRPGVDRGPGAPRLSSRRSDGP